MKVLRSLRVGPQILFRQYLWRLRSLLSRKFIGFLLITLNNIVKPLANGSVSSPRPFFLLFYYFIKLLIIFLQPELLVSILARVTLLYAYNLRCGRLDPFLFPFENPVFDLASLGQEIVGEIVSRRSIE
jgi:hypothetical protein